jgi:SlyX protein
MSDERLIDIETRIAHQDHALNELNEVVTAQQARLMQLERLCASLAERIADMSESARSGSPEDERPPHY